MARYVRRNGIKQITIATCHRDVLEFLEPDWVIDTDYQLERYIESLKPSHMVIGEEYREKRIIGKEFCEKITFIPRIGDFSTTNIIKTMKNA